MLFNSYKFLVFFPIVVALYFAVPKKAKSPWLLLSSYYFYMSWNARYGLLLLSCTLFSFAGAIFIEKFNSAALLRRRRAVFVASLLLLFSVLFIYKYLNFSVSLLAKFFSLLNFSLPHKRFDITLPVGISFFTFQAAGYVVDVWRGTVKAERNFIKYALFVSFFPQLVAGPIERSRSLLSQLDEPKAFDFELAKDGVFQMLWGFFLKMVIADRAAVFVDAMYNSESLETLNGMILVIATVFFAFQIYCDFCGYSVIARGASQILGIRLAENFRAPYCALSVKDFWRRWHISLSSWFKDYVYIPLGGNRCSKLRGYANLVITMALSGLWHGAGFHFLAWGCLHGFLQVLERMTEKIRSHIPKAIQWLMTFICVNIGWVFFRAPSLRKGVYILQKMFGSVMKGQFFTSEELFQFTSVTEYARRFRLAFAFTAADMHLLLFCIGILLLADFVSYKGFSVRALLQRQNPAIQVLAVAVSITLIAIYGVWGSAFSKANFIYFQF